MRNIGITSIGRNLKTMTTTKIETVGRFKLGLCKFFAKKIEISTFFRGKTISQIKDNAGKTEKLFSYPILLNRCQSSDEREMQLMDSEFLRFRQTGARLKKNGRSFVNLPEISTKKEVGGSYQFFSLFCNSFFLSLILSFFFLSFFPSFFLSPPLSCGSKDAR